MNRGPFLFLGILFTLASSFWGLVLVPQLQIGRQEIVLIAATGELYPSPRPGRARAGAQVYRSLGCAECHTQQVRARGFGTDFERGWGLRFSVAQDYLRDHPVQLGNLRAGPDLANIGLRQTNATWHLVHLYNPALTSPGSLMPRYPFLFSKTKLPPGRKPSADALPLNRPRDTGFEIVPREEAHDLVAYLLSLRAAVGLFESPLPAAPAQAPGSTNVSGAINTNAAPATNAPAPNTNLPAGPPAS